MRCNDGLDGFVVKFVVGLAEKIMKLVIEFGCCVDDDLRFVG